MYLGIEIGGTKLQLAIGSGVDQNLLELVRVDVQPHEGAEGILRQILEIGTGLLNRHPIQAMGIGFGGPVDTKTGSALNSFQVEGWKDFPLASWSQKQFGLPTWIENDSNLAGLGEALLGAGREHSVVFYTNIGSGIGGALILDGVLYPGGVGNVASEIGHLRPGLANTSIEQTVESIASGWGIARAGREFLRNDSDPESPEKRELLSLCEENPSQLTGKQIATARIRGNRQANKIFEQAIKTYGWAIAQAATLLAPDIIIVGGGVAQLGESLFFAPLRQQVDTYVFEPLRGKLKIIAAELGEEVVLYGAISMAKSMFHRGS